MYVLSLVVISHVDLQDYIFSLLTGYCDPPTGVEVADGMHYNPYFPGGLTGMAQALFDEVVEYEDGMYCLCRCPVSVL